MSTRRFTIEAVADITKYAEGMAKIPGVTEKEAAKASLKFAAELNKGYGKALADAERAAKGMAESVEDAFVVTAGDIADAVRGVWEFGRGIVDLQAEIANTAARSGLAADTVQGLDLALKGAGLSVKDLEGDLNQFPAKMVEAAKGAGGAADSFRALGVEVTDASGELRSADDVFRDTLTALGQVADPAQRAAVALQLMGEGGARLQQTGALQNLDAFVELTARFGVETGPEATRQAKAFAQGMATLETVAQGTAARVLSAFTGGAGSMAGAVETVTRAVIVLGAGLEAMGEIASERIADLLVPLEGLAIAIDRGPAAGIAFLAENWDRFGSGVLKTINPIAGGVELIDRTTSKAAASLAAYGELSAATLQGAAAGTMAVAAAAEEHSAATAKTIDHAEALRKLIADASSDTVTAEERVRAAYAERVAAIEEARVAGADAFAVSLAQSEAEERMIRDLAQIHAQATAQRAAARAAADAAIGQAQTPEAVRELRDAELDRLYATAQVERDNLTLQAELAEQYAQTQIDAERRLRQLQQQRVGEMAAGVGDLAGNTAAAFAFASQQMAESGNKAALAMFRASQVASVAQIGFAVAEGIARIAAIAAIRPALAAVAGASLAVAQGTALAMVAAQKPPQIQTFDTGGQVGGLASPMTQTGEQVAIRAVPGEVVVDSATARAAGGPGGVQAALSGQAGGQQRVRLELTREARQLLKFRAAPGLVGVVLATASRSAPGAR